MFSGRSPAVHPELKPMISITSPGTRIRPTRRPGLVACVLLVGLLGLAACSKASAEDPLGYLAKTKNRIVFVEWTAASPAPSSSAASTGGARAGTQNLRGTATLVLIDRDKLTLASDLATFTGTLAGSSIALTMAKPLDSATTWSGTLTGTQLTLSYTAGDGTLVSLDLQQATRSAFSTAIITQQQAFAGLQTNAEANKSEAEIKADIDKYSKLVSQDMATLSSDVAAVSAAVPPITAANASAQSFKASANSNSAMARKHQYGPTICPLANAASAAANGASGASAAASAANDRLNALVATAKKQITKLSTDHGNLASATAALTSYQPNGLPTDKQVTDAITSANTAITDAIHSGNGAARTAVAKASSAQSAASSAQAACASAPQVNPSPKPSPTKK
jgi:hypothetical protein